jgi:hypothetical protein
MRAITVRSEQLDVLKLYGFLTYRNKPNTPSIDFLGRIQAGQQADEF